MFMPPASFLAPADSARAVSDVYSVSLLATLPVLMAMVVFFWLRRSNAGTRAVVWRCTLVGLLIIYAGRFMPGQWIAWILPELLARPMVALGTVQLGASPGIQLPAEPAPSVSTIFRGLLLLYWGGVILVLLRTFVARIRFIAVARHSANLSGPLWDARLREAGDAVGVPTGAVRLLISRHVSVPVTWGVRQPVILLPHSALQWTGDRLQAVLRHELAHVRARDAAMILSARITCALFWFHPGVWWLARRFELDAEQACDDRVLLSGVRASDYAEWLAAVAPGAGRQLDAAMAFARRGNLRTRLAAVTNTRRRIAVPGRATVLFTVALAVAIVAPLSTVRLAPTRDVLTSLMLETRWESRAWAVVRLAQRADSVDVARSAARHDPDPAVRAWARYALARVVAPPAAASLPRS
jgi:beta-lactamase regulating signal transducer with metallopeptidase domain